MSSKKTIENTKLIKLLSTFSTLEWKRFGRFVQSPYHNTNAQVITLYTILKKAFPFEISKELEQERIYKKIYGKELFKLSKFQNLCSDLYELATDFVVDVHLSKEKRKKKKVIVDALSERNYELFRGASQQLIKEVKTQEYYLDEDDFLLLYQLNDGLWYHLEKDKYTIQQEEFDNIINYLNYFYESKDIRLKAEGAINRNFLKRKVNTNSKETRHLGEIFERVLLLHESKLESEYFQLKQDIQENWINFKYKDKQTLLIHLINFAIVQEVVKTIFATEALNLYQIGLNENLFIVNGRIRDLEFLNIALFGLKTKKIQWVKAFLNSHKNYLDPTQSIFLLPLIEAYIARINRDYEKIIDLLKFLNPPNRLVYFTRIKRLLIRAYFEGLLDGKEEYLSPLNYLLDASTKATKRENKLSDERILAYKNFILLTKKLLKLIRNSNKTSDDITEIEQKINTTYPLSLKRWFQEKLTQIKNATY